jgi:hypothetical protein
MVEKVGDGDIDEVEAELALGLKDHREVRNDNDYNKAGRQEVRLRQRIEHFRELIARPSDNRLRIRLKYPPSVISDNTAFKEEPYCLFVNGR